MGDGGDEMGEWMSLRGPGVVGVGVGGGNRGTDLAQPMARGLVSQSGGRWIKFPMTQEAKLVLQGLVIFIS